jgi:uncharacterized membrane protein
MGAGLIDIAAQTRQQAMQGLGDAAKLEQERQMQSDALKSQQKSANMTTIGSLAGAGAAIGSVVPGVGTAVGAGIGALAGVVANWL